MYSAKVQTQLDQLTLMLTCTQLLVFVSRYLHVHCCWWQCSKTSSLSKDINDICKFTLNLISILKIHVCRHLSLSWYVCVCVFTVILSTISRLRSKNHTQLLWGKHRQTNKHVQKCTETPHRCLTDCCHCCRDEKRVWPNERKGRARKSKRD